MINGSRSPVTMNAFESEIFSELVLAAKTPRCKSIIVVDEIESRATAWLKRFLIETSEGTKLVQYTDNFRRGLSLLGAIL
jgi:hypothetical protein